MWKFDMKLQEDSQYWDDQKVFTLWQKPPLNIKLSPRKFEERRKADWNWNCRYVCDKGAFFVLDVLDVLGSLSFRILRYDSKSFLECYLRVILSFDKHHYESSSKNSPLLREVF
jgi:hypothetical protein